MGSAKVIQNFDMITSDWSLFSGVRFVYKKQILEFIVPFNRPSSSGGNTSAFGSFAICVYIMCCILSGNWKAVV